MNLIHKSIKYKNEKTLILPFEGRAKCNVKAGQFFSRGDVLFSTDKRRVIESYFLPKELDVKQENLKDYICRINGEYITKDEIIAERLVSGGLMTKRVVSEVEGIVDFSRLELGYVDILAELKSDDFVSKFSGQVIDVNMSKGLVIVTDVCKMPIFYINDFVQKKYLNNLNAFTGTFEVLNDGKSISSIKNLDDSYEDKILFAGRFMYPDMVRELFARGCKFVLVGSMDYNDFIGLNLPVGILSGFGNIYFDDFSLIAFHELNATEVCIDVDSQSLDFMVGLNKKMVNIFKSEFFNKICKDDFVKSRDIESFGMVGRVVSLEDDGNYASVLMQNDSTFLIHTDNLEIYKEDFSTIGMSLV